MNRPAIARTSRPIANPVPEILEPCPWCTELAIVAVEDGLWTVRCSACSVSAGVGPASRLAPRHTIAAAA